MIRHCVFIRFNIGVSSIQRDALFSDIEGLQARLNGILAVHRGRNVSPETGMDKGFSEGFMIDFDTAENRDIYLSDAEHKAIGARLVKAADGGVDGILVYDLELADSAAACRQ